MNAKDLDLTVRLAQFIGARDADACSVQDFTTPGSITYFKRDGNFTLYNGGSAMDWEPLRRPDHAVIVAETALRRGLLLNLSAYEDRVSACCSHFGSLDHAGSADVSGIPISEAIAGAISLAVLRASELATTEPLKWHAPDPGVKIEDPGYARGVFPVPFSWEYVERSSR